ncbi:MAG: hypothetical protein NZ561_10665, partial [Phycisphaerae bacterium]|nr:hypothetical protein [Phycisphaerae bacterium]
IDADFYCANGHKWMMAPASVGFLHVSARQKRATRSIISSWGHGYLPHQADDEAFPGTSRWQYDLEFHGTADRTPQMVLPEVIGFRQSIGGDSAIRARVRHLTTRLRNHLRELNLRPFSPDDARLVGNLTAILLPEPFQQPGGFLASPADTPAARLQRRLWEHHRIECPVTHADGRTFLRISTGWFNTEQEIDRLALALRQELAA